MSEREDRPVPDPRYRQLPNPQTVNEVVQRIVEYVSIAVEDQDESGPAYLFDRVRAEAVFADNWGQYIAKRLKNGGAEAWPREWMNIVEVAKEHGRHAVKLAKAAGHKPVSLDDFKEGGKRAAEYCRVRFKDQVSQLGCWCNDPC